MDLGLLRTFLQVAKHGGIRKAAEPLYLTPSAISARIRQLEEEIGAPLFERSKHGTHLTPAGERLRHQAEELLTAWNRLRRNVALPEGAEALLAVGATDSIWQSGLLDVLPRAQQEQPSLVLRVEAGPADALTQGLLDGWLDVVLLFDPPHASGLKSEFVAEMPLLLVSTQAGLSVADIDAAHFIQVDWGSSFDSVQAGVLGRPLAGMTRTTVGSLALQWLLRRGGTALLPATMLAPYLEDARLFRVAGANSIGIPVHLARSARIVDATAAAAIDTVLQLLRAGVFQE